MTHRRNPCPINRYTAYLRAMWSLAIAMVCGVAVGCGGAEASRRGDDSTTPERSASLLSGERTGDQHRCDANKDNREVSEYDTSGDEYPDVRKVFQSVGDGGLTRLILICREADLNGDGTKDVVRHYTDEGRPLREEADRNFDGKMDEVTYFESGRIIRQELDSNGNGQVDTKVFYERGKPLRSERDMAGRSSAGKWQPDRWEYFEKGRMVRMGTDLDGDGRVDRWDRDAEYHHQLEAERAKERAAESEEEAEEQS